MHSIFGKNVPLVQLDNTTPTVFIENSNLVHAQAIAGKIKQNKIMRITNKVKMSKTITEL